jgi:hypothetical protein
MVHINGQWVTRDRALSLMLREKGYIHYKDWFLPREEAAGVAKGLYWHEGEWLSREELSRRFRAAEDSPPLLAAVEAEATEKKGKVEPETPSEQRKAVADRPPREARKAVADRSPSEASTGAGSGVGPVTAKRETVPRKTGTAPRRANKVHAFLASVRPGQGEFHHGLTLFSLIRRQEEWGGKDTMYMTLREAVARGVAKIKETGTVSRLLVEKRRGTALFTVGGTIILGGRQDRMIGPDVVLDSEMTKAYIMTYCIEQSRWKGSKTFDIADCLAVSELRKRSYNGERQQSVWQEVEKLRQAHGIRKSGGSYQKLLTKYAVKRQLRRYEKAFRDFRKKLETEPAAIGLAAMVNDRLVGADLFVNKELFLSCLDELMRTYAAEAALAKGKAAKAPPDTSMREKISRLLSSAMQAACSSAGNQNYLEYRLSDGRSNLYGYALATERAPVHISLFADGRGLTQARAISRPPNSTLEPRKPVARPPRPEPKPHKPSSINDDLEKAGAVKRLKEGKLKPFAPLTPPKPEPPAPVKPRTPVPPPPVKPDVPKVSGVRPRISPNRILPPRSLR